MDHSRGEWMPRDGWMDAVQSLKYMKLCIFICFNAPRNAMKSVKDYRLYQCLDF